MAGGAKEGLICTVDFDRVLDAPSSYVFARRLGNKTVQLV